MENRMLRFANVELRAKDNEKKNDVEGIACVFDTETDIGWFKEKIDRHAFDNCDMSDVVLNFNHDDNYLLARTTNNSLFLSIDDEGLHQKATIIDTQQGNDIYKMVSEKLITKMSFSFVIDEDGGEEWIDDTHRVIKKIKRLFDVSLVSFPAYPTTEAFARSENLIDELALRHRKELETMEENKDLNEVVEEKQNEDVKEEKADEVVEDKVDETKADDNADVVDNEQKAKPIVEEQKEEKSNDVKEKENRKMEKDLTLDKTVAENAIEERKATNDAYDTPEYRKAYRNYIMTGDDKEVRAGIKSTDAGVPVPTIFQSKIETAWEKLGIANEVSKSFIKGIFKVSHEVSADGANYHTEGGDAPDEEEVVLATTTLIPMMVKKWISITDELLAMTDDEFYSYVASEVVYQVLRFVEDKILVGVGQGTGDNEGIVGIANAPLTESVSASMGFNAINEGASACECAEGDLMVAMNRATFYKEVMGLTDLQGRPIYNVALDNTGKPAYFINGLKVLFSNALPTYANAEAGKAWAIVGDFKAYKLNMPEGDGVKTLFDPYTLATQDKSRMIGRIFVAGNVVRAKALAKLVKPSASV